MIKTSKTQLFFLLFLLFLCACSFIVAISFGSTNLSIIEIFQALSSKQQNTHHLLIYELRLPRALTAFACGAMLALAGLLMQVLLRNPLADPYILGVSGGAATFALIAMLIGLEGGFINISAFLGAILSIYLVFQFSYQAGNWNVSRLLLTGVVMASGWGAIISFLLVVSPIEKIHGLLFWLMGEISYDQPVAGSYFILFCGLVIAFQSANKLNILSWGEIHASSLGVQTNKLRLLIFFLASLLTASAVTIAGNIGFIGLVIPHLLRIVTGNEHRVLVPASVMAGGSLLVIADTLARTIVAPSQLPVGILTAFIGVPLFLFLLRKNS
ncbi:MAG: iron ABC transporter permease [Pseudomonadota bacterium]